jgi:hypothetical protein
MKVRFIDDIHLISAEAWHTRVNQNGGWLFKQPFVVHHFLPLSYP